MLHTTVDLRVKLAGLWDTEMLVTSDCLTQVAAGQGRKNIWGCFVEPIDGAFENGLLLGLPHYCRSIIV